MKIIDISKCSEDVVNYINKFQNNYFELEKLYKEKESEIERLNNIIKQIEKCIEYYAIENEDFSKFYNNEEIEILKIIGSDKE